MSKQINTIHDFIHFLNKIAVKVKPCSQRSSRQICGIIAEIWQLNYQLQTQS